jgi:Protein of unknown function (DUF2637)
MTAADRIIRWSTALAVLGVAVVAGVVSYEHAGDLVRAHGETGWTGRLIPLTVDGLIYASSMVMLDSARRKAPVPALVRWLLGLGIAATLAAEAQITAVRRGSVVRQVTAPVSAEWEVMCASA